ncbi:MAG: PAS domain-containing protein [Pegethrix bostrychoides GSE-TBD4-15B]|jgi:PAS domain S-box-containing protein|uniref:Circadian input-output histidine kinase CikA n=1 Tax=Pegethrix bostrychoides GSE-TBD4-15B TaxID=2839662 RepID=A0A951U4F8_9CYAN|nr:PAS domain-containing protein [Pegethrix bostrychoides GSE-TBD4-15B]
MAKSTIPEHILASSGEVGALLQSFDWSTTAIGAIETWPQSLWTAVTLCLPSRFPMAILWGSSLTQIYNDGYRVILGTKHPGAMGQPTQDCWPEVWQFNEPIYQAVMTEGQVTYLEDQLYPVKRDGHVEDCYFTLCYSPIYEGATVGGILVTVLETTRQVQKQQQSQSALSESEGRLRQLAETVSSVFWLVDLNPTQLLYISPAYERIWGRSAAEIYGNLQRWIEFVHPDDRERVKSAPARCREQGSYEEEYRIIRPDGSIRWVRDRGFAVRDETGELYRLAGVAEDVTDWVRLAAERDQILCREQGARAEAEQANRIKDEFLAVLSHEIRTPLNPILGWAQILRGGRLSPERTAEAVEIIERNAQLQVQLINDLLDISRILQGKLNLQPVSVDLAQVTTAALETIRLAAEAKELRLRVDAPPGCCFIRGDVTRLQQVIWNLISNAVKFTPAGGEIEIQLTQVGQAAQLQVRDSGRGIDPEFLPHVFEYFRQQDGSTTRKFGGLGLRLAIVRQIVELHGGTVAAESAGDGQGATFTVTVPLEKTARLASPSPQPEPSAAADLPLEGLRVLVVDDDLDSRQLAAFVVKEAGARVVAVPSGQAALQVLESIRPDVVVSDIGMPDMDGYLLMQQMRALALNPAVKIALTAYASEVDHQQALAAGFDQHLVKPFNPAALVETIAQLIARCPSLEGSLESLKLE